MQQYFVSIRAAALTAWSGLDWRPPALPLHLAMSSGSSSTVFLGTFTGGPGGGMASDHGPSESEGIYTAAFNADTGVSELCPAVPGPQPASQ